MLAKKLLLVDDKITACVKQICFLGVKCQNVQFEFRQDFKSLFFAVRTSTYVRYCIQKSNNDHVHNLLFSSLR